MVSTGSRVARVLLGGCVVLLGVSVTACGASPYTDVSSTGLTLD